MSMQAQSLPPNPPLFSDCGSRPSDGMAVSPRQQPLSALAMMRRQEGAGFLLLRRWGMANAV